MSRRRPISRAAVDANAPGRCPKCARPNYGSHVDAICASCARLAETLVTPGHPVAAGAGYDCTCGECCALRGVS